jgi:hypothetical protein
MTDVAPSSTPVAVAATVSSSSSSSTVATPPRLLSTAVDELCRLLQGAADALEAANMERSDYQQQLEQSTSSSSTTSGEALALAPPPLPKWWTDSNIMDGLRSFGDYYLEFRRWRDSSPDDVSIVQWAKATQPLISLFVAAVDAKQHDAILVILPCVIVFSRDGIQMS